MQGHKVTQPSTPNQRELGLKGQVKFDGSGTPPVVGGLVKSATDAGSGAVTVTVNVSIGALGDAPALDRVVGYSFGFLALSTPTHSWTANIQSIADNGDGTSTIHFAIAKDAAAGVPEAGSCLCFCLDLVL